MHQRNLRMLERRRELQDRKEAARRATEARAEEIASRVAIEAARDPTRLLRPTAGLEERRKADKEPVVQGFIRNVGHLKTPSWRKGV